PQGHDPDTGGRVLIREPSFPEDRVGQQAEGYRPGEQVEPAPSSAGLVVADDEPEGPHYQTPDERKPAKQVRQVVGDSGFSLGRAVVHNHSLCSAVLVGGFGESITFHITGFFSSKNDPESTTAIPAANARSRSGLVDGTPPGGNVPSPFVTCDDDAVTG